MFRMYTSKATRAGALCVMAVAIALLLFPAEKALAAGEWGPYRGSSVYCEEHFGTSKLQVQALVSRNTGFSSQWVAFSHRLKNIDTGKVTQLYTSNNLEWYSFNDTHIINSGWPYTGDNLVYNNPVPHGRYRVETRYAWYSGYWVYSNWIDAAYYNNYGLGAGAPCYL